MDENLKWIQSGKTGCTFATLFSKDPESIGWRSYNTEMWKLVKKHGDLGNIVSIYFLEDGANKDTVKKWALNNGFYLEETSAGTEGLRLKTKQGIAWVQYFGPDSHVKTRQSPEPMLIYCNKVGLEYYAKVGFKGILHLAHAWRDGMKQKVADLLWNRAHKQTKKIIGHDLTIFEAAKTTFLK